MGRCRGCALLHRLLRMPLGARRGQAAQEHRSTGLPYCEPSVSLSLVRLYQDGGNVSACHVDHPGEAGMPLIARADSLLVVVDLQPGFWADRFDAGDLQQARNVAARAAWLAGVAAPWMSPR